jgi:nucleoside-diphosphate kinase
MVKRTVCVIKPDAFERYDEIWEDLKSRGYHIEEALSSTVDKRFWTEWYSEHKARESFNQLVEFMASGPCLFMVLSKNENVILELRSILGSSDPKMAADGTLRRTYGTSIPNNAIHASDSVEAFERELKMIQGLRSQNK